MNMPIEPDESDCCGSGCNPCIFDIYQKQLELYFKKTCCSEPEDFTSKLNNCLSQTSYSVFRLANIERDAEDTNIYTFKFVRKCKQDDNENCRLIFKPGQHIAIRGKDENTETYFTRPYSILPSKDRDKLKFMVILKIWSMGRMSTYIDNLQIGDEVLCRGPYGGFELNFKWKHILMIAQGTGIAPIYSVIRKVVDKEDCETFLKLYFVVKTDEHIHFRNEFREMSSNWNFTYEVFVDEIKNKIRYKENIRVKKLLASDIQEYCNSKKCDNNYQVLICGNKDFAQLMVDNCKKCGIKEEFIHRF